MRHILSAQDVYEIIYPAALHLNDDEANPQPSQRLRAHFSRLSRIVSDIEESVFETSVFRTYSKPQLRSMVCEKLLDVAYRLLRQHGDYLSGIALSLAALTTVRGGDSVRALTIFDRFNEQVCIGNDFFDDHIHYAKRRLSVEPSDTLRQELDLLRVNAAKFGTDATNKIVQAAAMVPLSGEAGGVLSQRAVDSISTLVVRHGLAALNPVFAVCAPLQLRRSEFPGMISIIENAYALIAEKEGRLLEQSMAGNPSPKTWERAGAVLQLGFDVIMHFANNSACKETAFSSIRATWQVIENFDPVRAYEVLENTEKNYREIPRDRHNSPALKEIFVLISELYGIHQPYRSIAELKSYQYTGTLRRYRFEEQVARPN